MQCHTRAHLLLVVWHRPQPWAVKQSGFRCVVLAQGWLGGGGYRPAGGRTKGEYLETFAIGILL